MKTIKEFLLKYNDYDIFDEEADKDGKIRLTTSTSTHGGRENEDIDWEVEKLSDEDDYWEVRATVVKTDNPRQFKKGWYIDFDLYKDTDINDLPDEILRAVEDERDGAWSSGH